MHAVPFLLQVHRRQCAVNKWVRVCPFGRRCQGQRENKLKTLRKPHFSVLFTRFHRHLGWTPCYLLAPWYLYCCPWSAVLSSPESLWKMENLRYLPQWLKQSPHFNSIPRRSICTCGFKKPWFTAREGGGGVGVGSRGSKRDTKMVTPDGVILLLHGNLALTKACSQPLAWKRQGNGFSSRVWGRNTFFLMHFRLLTSRHVK